MSTQKNGACSKDAKPAAKKSICVNCGHTMHMYECQVKYTNPETKQSSKICGCKSPKS